ncbi:C_GCAxxG_C_C family protein [bacterium]|nr:C_GCAxxG_C_C family protein [bacterium]
MRAAEYFQNGFSCSESLIKWAIDEKLVPEELLPVATPFSGGMGVGCLCGAISGAQMIIGSQFGRDNKYGNEMIARSKAKEFIQKFTEMHKATCCRVLTRGLDMASPERKAHCVNMVDDCQKLVEEVLKIKV